MSLWESTEEDKLVCICEQNGERIDKYLAVQFDFSRTFLQALLDQGKISMNGRIVKQSSKKVHLGDRLEVILPPPAVLDVEPEAIPITIVYEDADLLVVDKPRGMVVHPGAGHEKGTLVAAVLHHVRDLAGIGGTLRPGIVHRIDKDTSGLLLIAKTDLAHQGLSAQLKEHTVKRLYEAMVHGNVAHAVGRIEAPIGRDVHQRQRMAVVREGDGKEAITHFRVKERFADFTFLELRLETGRTHQIRVHLSYIGHPLVGDFVYHTKDPFALHGQFLHAKMIGFHHPRTGEYLEFETPMPQALQDVKSEIERRFSLPID